MDVWASRFASALRAFARVGLSAPSPSRALPASVVPLLSLSHCALRAQKKPHYLKNNVVFLLLKSNHLSTTGKLVYVISRLFYF